MGREIYDIINDMAEVLNASQMQKLQEVLVKRLSENTVSEFQVKINSEIKRAVEDIYAKTGMTLTDAFNTFIQQSLNVEGLPFIVTKNSKEALREQAVAMLMLDLKRAEERAEIEGWIDADDLERELNYVAIAVCSIATLYAIQEGFYVVTDSQPK